MKLLICETYLILLVNVTGRHEQLCLPQYSAGIVLGGLYDLLASGCIAEQSDGRLIMTASLPEEYSGLEELYRSVNGSLKSKAKLLDDFSCSVTSKKITSLLDDLYYSLKQKGILETEIRKGFFRQKRFIRLSSQKACQVVERFLKEAHKPEPDDSTVFCIQMLQFAEVLKQYFSMGERRQMRSVLRQCAQTEMWRKTEPYVNRIKNFNYQNAVNSGAVYQ